AGEVVDHVHLRNVGGEAADLGAALIQAQQGDHRFVDLAAVIDATAGEDHGNFLLHGKTPSRKGLQRWPMKRTADQWRAIYRVGTPSGMPGALSLLFGSRLRRAVQPVRPARRGAVAGGQWVVVRASLAVIRPSWVPCHHCRPPRVMESP